MNRSIQSILFIIFLCTIPTLALINCTTKKKPTEEKKKEPTAAEPSHGLTKEQAAQVLVKVGDTKISVGQFANRLADQSPYLRARYNAPERRKEFLDNMVQFELLALEAKKRGYDKSEDVERIRKQKMVQQMLQELFEKEDKQLSDVKEEEIREYYDSHHDEFNKPAQVRISHILVKDEAKAKIALKKALAKPGDMQNFRKLVSEYSEDEKTREKKGDLSFFSETKGESANEPDIPDAIRQSAFSLEKHGDVFPSLIHTDQGFHVIMLSGKRNAYNRSFEEARRMIQNRLWRKKREDAINKFVDDLREKANIQQNLEALEQVAIELDETDRSASPNPSAAHVPKEKPEKKAN